MSCQVHGTEVAYGDLVGTGVQGDFGAQVGAVHHAPVLLRRTQVARVLEGDPGVAGFEQHGEHLAPELLGRDLLEQLDFALLRQRLVMLVAFPEGVAVQVVQIRRIAGENRVQSRSSRMRSISRSGTQLAVFISWVRRRSSPCSYAVPGIPRCPGASSPGRRTPRLYACRPG